MAVLKINGIPPYDGEYVLDLDEHPLKMREWATIKRVANVLAGQLEAALQGGDIEVVVALAVIGLERAGHSVNEHALWESELGQIEVVGDTEDDAGPPDLTTSEQPSERSGEPERSGTPSDESGDATRVMIPLPTGQRV